MKKRTKKTIIGLFICSAIVSFIAKKQSSNKSFDLIKANIEALTNTEFDPIYQCKINCRDKYGYICILKTNIGFDINCDNMVPWLSNI